MRRTTMLTVLALLGSAAFGQTKAPLPPVPVPQSIPKPAGDTGGPYAPQSILPGGIVVPLFAPNSPYLKADKLHVPEIYNMSQTVHGRISSIVSIHNPSIEVHKAEKAINTGTAVIVIAGGGHRTLNVGGEGADFVPFFYNYGINTVILRNRLRADGYVAEVDAVHDAQQAVRVVRAYAKELGIDPNRIGVMGFSAGAELATAAAVLYEDWDKKNIDPSDPFAGISSRPDFVGIIYPGRRRSRGIAPRRPSRRTFRRHFWPVAAPAIVSTRSGPSSTTRRCSTQVFPMSKCTSTATAAILATRCRTGAACPAG